MIEHDDAVGNGEAPKEIGPSGTRRSPELSGDVRRTPMDSFSRFRAGAGHGWSQCCFRFEVPVMPGLVPDIQIFGVDSAP